MSQLLSLLREMMWFSVAMFTVPESVYLMDKLRRINFSYNQIRELSSLVGGCVLNNWVSVMQSVLMWIFFVLYNVDTWTALVTLDLSHNLLTALHVRLFFFFQSLLLLLVSTDFNLHYLLYLANESNYKLHVWISPRKIYQ